MHLKEAHELTGIAHDVATCLGITMAALYFGWRVFFQKTFQRLSIDVDATPLGTGDSWSGQLAVQCTIKNQAEARVDLRGLKYCIELDGKQFRGKFESNIDRSGVDSYSIDAKSIAQFCAKVDVPKDAKAVLVAVKFSPKLTNETYKTQKAVAIR
jgi:hypothetical protein